LLEKLDEHEVRIQAIEGLLIEKKNATMKKGELNNVNYSGPKGGILLLIKKEYFESMRTAEDVKNELDKDGYHYQKRVIQTALNRLSNIKGPLVKFEENGKKVYAKRK